MSTAKDPNTVGIIQDGKDSLEHPTSIINSPSPSGNGKKAVTFFLETPTTDGPSLGSLKLSKDEITSLCREDVDELVSKLQQKVERLAVDYSGEKALRKKKEKNLIKLAKQLNLNAKELNDKNEKIKQVLYHHLFFTLMKHSCNSIILLKKVSHVFLFVWLVGSLSY